MYQITESKDGFSKKPSVTKDRFSDEKNPVMGIYTKRVRHRLIVHPAAHTSREHTHGLTVPSTALTACVLTHSLTRHATTLNIHLQLAIV